jgi:hypothetical protein
MRFSQLKVIAAVNFLKLAIAFSEGRSHSKCIGAYGRGSRAAIKARQNARLNNAR